MSTGDAGDQARTIEEMDRERALKHHHLQSENQAAGQQLIDELGRVICEDCCEPISQGRIDIFPGVTLCVECKTLDDELNKR